VLNLVRGQVMCSLENGSLTLPKRRKYCILIMNIVSSTQSLKISYFDYTLKFCLNFVFLEGRFFETRIVVLLDD